MVHEAASVDTAYDSSSVTSLFRPAATITVRVFEVDAASIFLGSQTVAIAEGGLSKQYSVVLGSTPSVDVVVNVTVPSVQSSEVQVLPAEVTFTPMNWNVAQFFVVTAVNDDFLDSPVVQFTLKHAAQSTDLAFDSTALGSSASALILPSDEVRVFLFDDEEVYI